MCVCVCVCERESVFVYERNRESVFVCDNFALKSGDNILPRVSEFKFLFVTFDTQLTFIAHINNITKH